MRLIAAILLLGMVAIPAGTQAARSVEGPVLVAASPQTLDEDAAPVELTLVGENFTRGSLVRVLHGNEEQLAMDLTPVSITGTRISVLVDAEWFDMLRQAPETPTGLRQAGPALPDHFLVKVIGPDGRASQARSVRIDRAPVRVARLPLRQVAAGSWTQVEVRVERRDWDGEIPLVVRAFDPASPAGGEDVESRPLSNLEIPGIFGAGLIAAGESSGLIGIWVADSVPPGDYQFDVITLLVTDACPAGQGCTVSVVQDLTVVLPACTPNCPPLPPSGLQIEETTITTIAMSWHDQATDELGIAVERRPPGGNWSTIANLAPAANPPGVSPYMQYTDSGLAPGTQYCYRIREWNAFGSAYSVEACATTGAPPELVAPKVWVHGAGSQYITVDWYDQTDHEDKYSVLRCNSTEVKPFCKAFGTVFTAGPMNQGEKGTFTDTSTVAGKLYCYQVRVNNAFDEAYAEWQCAVAGSQSPPSDGGGGNGNGGGGNGSGDGGSPADLVAYGAMWTDVGFWPKPGQPFTLYQNVCNFGGKASGGFTDAYSETPANGSPALYPKDQSSLAPGQCIQAKLTYDDGLPAGDWYFAYCADTKNAVTEASETNNCNYLGLWVGF